jgi:uncharacterized Fe-S cluster-containing radical SAM superfamily protein
METLPLDMTKLAEKVRGNDDYGLPTADNLQIEEPEFTGGISTADVVGIHLDKVCCFPD